MPGSIIEEVKGKKYKIIIEAGKNPSTGKRKRVIRRIEGRKTDAQDLMAQIIMELKTGTYIEPKATKVSDWLSTWLNDYKKMEIRQTTWESYEVQVRKHLTPAIGALNVQELRPEHLQKLYNEKLTSGLSARSVRYIHHVIHSALKQAVKNQLVLRNVAEATVLPKQDKKKARAMTVEEQAAFLSVLEKDRLVAAFIVLMGTGIRRGELLGLFWRNVDLKKGTLAIEQNLVRVKGNARAYQEPKTEMSKGELPLNAAVMDALKAHRERMLSEGNHAPEKPVFCTKKGTTINPRNLSRKFDILRDKAKIPKDVTTHSLRHTFATRLLEQGVGLKEVQELLRHAQIGTTGNIYSHVSQEVKRGAVDKLNDVLTLGTNRAPETQNEDKNAKKSKKPRG